MFFFANWSRNKYFSKNIDYSLVIYTRFQLINPPNNGITTHPFVIAQHTVSATSPPLLPPTFGWSPADGV